MTTGYRTVEEHVVAARALLQESQSEYQESGATLQSSEKLWGAAAHAVIAKAKEEGWTVGSHRALVNASKLLAQQQNDESLELAFSIAQKFHNRFYGDSHFDPFAETSTLEDDRGRVARYVDRVLSIVEEAGHRNGAGE